MNLGVGLWESVAEQPGKHSRYRVPVQDQHSKGCKKKRKWSLTQRFFYPKDSDIQILDPKP